MFDFLVSRFLLCPLLSQTTVPSSFHTFDMGDSTRICTQLGVSTNFLIFLHSPSRLLFVSNVSILSRKNSITFAGDVSFFGWNHGYMYNVFNRLPIFLPDIITECSLQINPENHDVQSPRNWKRSKTRFKTWSCTCLICLFFEILRVKVNSPSVRLAGSDSCRTRQRSDDAAACGALGKCVERRADPRELHGKIMVGALWTHSWLRKPWPV